jgi:WD domain, G-beta repeat
VLREWTTLHTLAQVLHPRVLRAQVLEALEALSRRSLLERGQQASFGLQSVVMEYLTDELGEQFSKEIVLGNPQQLRQVALSQAQAKDYVRKSQVRLLVHPLLERLRAEMGANAQVEARLLRLLALFRREDAATQGYGPANVITLLAALRGHLRGLDLSRLSIRGAYLQGVEMQDTSLVGARLEESVLTEAFDGIWAVAISQSGQYWAAGSKRGEVRVWREGGQILHLAWQAHTDIAMALAFSPDERMLASGSLDGSLKLWDVESGALLWSGWQTQGTAWLAFTPDGSLLASGGHEGTVRLWDPKLGTALQELPHPGTVFSLAWSPDGHLLASGDVAGTIRLWQIEKSGSATCVQTLVGHTQQVRGLAFAPDSSVLGSASWMAASSSGRSGRREASGVCRRWWDIRSKCGAWPGVRMEACWPVAAMTTRFGCGRWSGSCACGSCRATMPVSTTWPGVQMGLHRLPDAAPGSPVPAPMAW